MHNFSVPVPIRAAFVQMLVEMLVCMKATQSECGEFAACVSYSVHAQQEYVHKRATVQHCSHSDVLQAGQTGMGSKQSRTIKASYNYQM